MNRHTSRQSRGAASIFVVAFFTLLIGIITLSFANLVIQDQQKALNNDLTQSAYDSAIAGTEDAQRALRWYGKECTIEKKAARSAATPPDTITNSDCAKLESNQICNIQKLSSKNVKTIIPGVKSSGYGKEVKLTQSTGTDDEKLSQAYTCVSLTTQTEDYKASLADGKSDTLIPLRTVGNVGVESIKLNWFNVGGNAANVAFGRLSLPNQNPADLVKPLRLANSDDDDTKGTKWGTGTPPILRVEVIPVTRAGGIDVNALDQKTRTVFLYPSSHASAPASVSISGQNGRMATKIDAPNVVKCDSAAAEGKFACSTTLTDLIRADGDAANTNTDLYLRITPIYNNTNLQILLYDAVGTTPLKFDNVAPQIVSTGRANDVYRRVETRVQTIMGANPTSDGGFDITQGLCKDFRVPNYDTACPATLVP